MRTHKQLVTHQSILQVLQESGCPFCRFLKEFQAERLQNHGEKEIRRLCNFHAWGLAAVQDAPAAAHVFLKMLEDSVPKASGDSECDICREVLAEEDLRLREFLSCLGMKYVTQWFSAEPALCIPHGQKLRRHAPATLVCSYRQYCRQLSPAVGAGACCNSAKNRSQTELAGDRLGRTAEFLVAQRGLHG